MSSRLIWRRICQFSGCMLSDEFLHLSVVVCIAGVSDVHGLQLQGFCQLATAWISMTGSSSGSRTLQPGLQSHCFLPLPPAQPRRDSVFLLHSRWLLWTSHTCNPCMSTFSLFEVLKIVMVFWLDPDTQEGSLKADSYCSKPGEWKSNTLD